MSRTTTKNLPCRISDEDRIRYGQEMAAAAQTLSEVQDAKKSAASQFKARENECNARLSLLANVVSSGVEFRDVQCTVDTDDQGNEIIIRNDTGELVAMKPLGGMFGNGQ